VSGQHHAPVALPPGNKLRGQLGRKPSGTQRRSGRFGEDKNLFASALTSPTGGGRSVSIVRVRTKAMEFSLVLVGFVPRTLQVRNLFTLPTT